MVVKLSLFLVASIKHNTYIDGQLTISFTKASGFSVHSLRWHSQNLSLLLIDKKAYVVLKLSEEDIGSSLAETP
jgi:hypothetical protein